MAWEQIGVLHNGMIFLGDKLRPASTTPDSNGGGLFKFVPYAPHAGDFITQLNQFAARAGPGCPPGQIDFELPYKKSGG